MTGDADTCHWPKCAARDLDWPKADVRTPKENVRAWIHEAPKQNWGISGVSAKHLGC